MIEGPGNASEADAERDVALRRLRLRSWRRGIKEMDLILGAFADDRLEELDRPTLALYEEMLQENDQELYQWVSGQKPVPDRFGALVALIVTHTENIARESRMS